MDDEDIISQCLNEIEDKNFTHLKKTEIHQKCLDKIITILYYFKHNNMMPDGLYCKVLENNIIEFRLQLPKSNHLLRIIGGYTPQQIVLLTGYLIKPEQYNDRKTITNTEKIYSEKITEAHNYWKDFLSAQQYHYTDLTDILFPPN